MVTAGFEPGLPKRADLECVAVDQSAIEPCLIARQYFFTVIIEMVAAGVSNKPPAGLEPATLRLKVPCSTD